jgi:dolichyl-phosphate-mannose-protein mannosyltransferase
VCTRDVNRARIAMVGTCVWCVCRSALLLLLLLRYREHATPSVVTVSRRLAFFITAYLLNVLPYILVSRCAFIYHYMPALLYAQLVTALLVDWIADDAVKYVAPAVTLAAAATYCYFSPWVYATPLSHAEHEAMRWLPGWS